MPTQVVEGLVKEGALAPGTVDAEGVWYAVHSWSRLRVALRKAVHVEACDCGGDGGGDGAGDDIRCK